MDPDSHSSTDAGQDADRPDARGEAPHAALDERLREALAPALEVKRRLGGGSRVQVYQAREVDLGRYVAVKVLLPEARTDVAGRRFEREAKAVARLSHPNVVNVHRYGRLPDDTPYMVMQYVKGRSLAERLKAEGPLSVQETRRILADVASALAAAHRQGIVHRNVRPSKVLYEEETGRVLLSDFGIAAILATEEEDAPRLTRPGQVLGDPRYMSPESLEGGELTARADVYSLGIVGYELLTGESPYGDRTSTQLVAAHLQEEPPPVRSLRPDVPDDLADLLARCLARKPGHRPDAAYVHRTLSESRADSGSAPGGHDPSLVQAMLGRRVPQWVGAAVAAAVGLVGIVSELAGNGILPLVTVHLALVFAAFGLLAVGVLSWFHGQKGRQHAPLVERVILGALAAGWLVASALILLT